MVLDYIEKCKLRPEEGGRPRFILTQVMPDGSRVSGGISKEKAKQILGANPSLFRVLLDVLLYKPCNIQLTNCKLEHVMVKHIFLHKKKKDTEHSIAEMAILFFDNCDVRQEIIQLKSFDTFKIEYIK